MKKIIILSTVLITLTNTISVNGHAEVKVKPDNIKVQINISNAYLEDGSTTQLLVDNFLEVLRKLNISSNQLKLVNTTFTDSYDTEIGKYENRTYTMSLASSEQYDLLSSEVLVLQGTTLFATEYSNANGIKYIQEAYQKALANCRENASYILNLNGLKLGEVVMIEDNSSNYSLATPYYGDEFLGVMQPLEVTYVAQLRIVYSFTK